MSPAPTGAVRITVVPSPACHFCEDADRALADLADSFAFELERVPLETPEGTRLVAEHRPALSPLVLVDGAYFSAGRLPRRKLTKLLAARGASLVPLGAGMGSELLTTGSVIAAFLAGGVALFAPCCIVFLAPSYLAAAVKSRRWRLLPLTFVFAAGLGLVLLPLTLGMSVLAGAIAKYHEPLYYAGGVLMIALAALALSGRMWSLPSFLRAPDTTRADTASFFALGVFSGIASSCCAPVLAGVMTLSALSATPAGGLVLGVAYVFGMVFPLFAMALLWDKAKLNERRFWRAKLVRIRVAGRTLVTNSVNLVVAVGFLAMGVAVIALANEPDMSRGTAAQSWASERLTATFLRIQEWASPVPEVFQALLLFLVVGGLVAATLTGRRRGVAVVTPGNDDPADLPSEPELAPVEGHPSRTHDGDAPSCHSTPSRRTHP